MLVGVCLCYDPAGHVDRAVAPNGFESALGANPFVAAAWKTELAVVTGDIDFVVGDRCSECINCNRVPGKTFVVVGVLEVGVEQVMVVISGAERWACELQSYAIATVPRIDHDFGVVRLAGDYGVLVSEIVKHL